MKVTQLIEWLWKIRDDYEGGGDFEVNVLIEANEPVKCQYEFPMNDMAVSKGTKTVILMHEKWTSMESLERDES